MINDDTLRQMTHEERSSLSRRLAAIDSNLPSLSEADERRRRFVFFLTVCSAALVPWIIFLAFTLPHRYVAGHWTLTWVGFDIALLTGLALTAWFAWRRRQAVVITAFITGTLLTCDAWFDVTTAVASHLLFLTVRRAQATQEVPPEPCGPLEVPLFGVTQRAAP
jgi:hypothetical protein